MRPLGLVLQIAGLTMLLTGAWWILQGMGWVGDPQTSYIAGKRNWAFIGAAVFAGGGLAFNYARKFRR